MDTKSWRGYKPRQRRKGTVVFQNVNISSGFTINTPTKHTECMKIVSIESYLSQPLKKRIKLIIVDSVIAYTLSIGAVRKPHLPGDRIGIMLCLLAFIHRCPASAKHLRT